MTFSKILTDQRDKKREGDVSSSHCNGVPMGNARSRMWMKVLVFCLLFLLACLNSNDGGNGGNGGNGGDGGDGGNDNGNGDTTYKYTCTNGTAASGEAASEGTEKCASCKDGYKLTDTESCVAIKYTCTDGTPKAGGSTTGNADVEFCASCKSGYGIAGNQCLTITTIDGDPSDDGGVVSIDGTTGPDTINGRPAFNTLNGLAGDDVLNGNAYADFLNGGPGADVLNGGPGIDTASYRDASAGVVVYLKATDGVNEGEAAGDTYNSIESLIGSEYDDILQGDDDPNGISGLAGDDVLNGGDGPDILNGGPGADVLNGGPGADTASYRDASAGVVVYLKADDGTNEGEAAGDTYSSISILLGSTHDDTLQGDDDPNFIYGEAGADIMAGGGGNDTFELETTRSDKDVIIDFAKGDKIRVDTSAGTKSNLNALKADANIDWVNTADHPTGTTTNDDMINDMVISDTQGTPNTADDVVIMVLEDYILALVIGDFEVY